MVFFTCNACGEALKKARVEIHYTNHCRRCEFVSCIDCGKDFYGDDYKSHLKCISEAEKYQGSDYKPTENKGDTKQNGWIENVHEAIAKSSATGRLKEILNKLLDVDNVPRKKAKFVNFVKSAMRIYDLTLISQAWDEITSLQKKEEVEEPLKLEASKEFEEKKSTYESSELKEKKLSKRDKKEERSKKQTKKQKKSRVLSNESNEITNDHCESKKENKSKHKETDEKENKKVKKRKRADSTDENDRGETVDEGDGSELKIKKRKKHARSEAEQPEMTKKVGETVQHDSGLESEEPLQENPKFSWNKIFVQVLKENGGELSVKKLRKKVLAAHLGSSKPGHEHTEVQLWAKFAKKLSKSSKIRVHKERAKLV